MKQVIEKCRNPGVVSSNQKAVRCVRCDALRYAVVRGINRAIPSGRNRLEVDSLDPTRFLQGLGRIG